MWKNDLQLKTIYRFNTLPIKAELKIFKNIINPNLPMEAQKTKEPKQS